MPVRRILHYPDPRLRERSHAVTDFGPALQQLIADMTETMRDADGAGLAAIQIGEPLRLFLVEGRVVRLRNATDEEREAAAQAEAEREERGEPPELLPPAVFANPELLELSETAQAGDEGCLSFPGVFVPVKRALRARIRAQDAEGRTFEMEGEGLFARALQHETDHLNGRLLVDNVGPVKREIIKRKLLKDARKERDGRAET